MNLPAEVEAMAGELSDQLTRFREIIRRPVPDEWPPARVAEVEDLTIELTASLIVVHEAACFLRTAEALGPYVSRVLDVSGRAANDPALQRHLVKKIAGELRSIRTTVDRLFHLYRWEPNA